MVYIYRDLSFPNMLVIFDGSAIQRRPDARHGFYAESRPVREAKADSDQRFFRYVVVSRHVVTGLTVPDSETLRISQHPKSDGFSPIPWSVKGNRCIIPSNNVLSTAAGHLGKRYLGNTPHRPKYADLSVRISMPNVCTAVRSTSVPQGYERILSNETLHSAFYMQYHISPFVLAIVGYVGRH